MSDATRLIRPFRPNSNNPSKKCEADFQFRRKQSLTARGKSFEAVGQTEMLVFLAIRLLCNITVMTTNHHFGAGHLNKFSAGSVLVMGVNCVAAKCLCCQDEWPLPLKIAATWLAKPFKWQTATALIPDLRYFRSCHRQP